MRLSITLCLVTGCTMLKFDIGSPSASDSDTGFDESTMTISGVTYYHENPLEYANVGLVYVATDGDWNADVSMVTDETSSDESGNFSVAATQLSSYWLLADYGHDVWSGLLGGVQTITLDEFGSTQTVDVPLLPVTHFDLHAGESCQCLYRWSHLNYTCCPTDSDDQQCSWLWDNCAVD